MNTAARRDRLLNLLHRAPSTVPAVAQELGVSERTVYRDIAWLREAGHAIRATPGPGGGVRVAPEARPRPVHFEVDEIVGLALSVAILQASPHAPFVGSARAALDRARRALSPERRREIRRLEGRILVGAPAAEGVRASLGAVEPGLVPVFERCFTGARAMAFDYVDGTGAASARRVECIALLVHPPAWYVLAWDLDKDAMRLFRMDRISAPAAGAPLDGQHSLAEAVAAAQPGREADLHGWGRRPLG